MQSNLFSSFYVSVKELRPLEKALPQLTQAIIDGCMRGNHNSQKKLYKYFYAFAMAICLRYARNRDEAAEIMNDGFLNVFNNIDRYNPEKPFKPWLGRIMNIGFGMIKPLSKQTSIIVQPFVKLPIAGIGQGQVNLQSFGLNLQLNYSVKKKK